MAVYVDEIRVWPHAKAPFLDGSCHLIADTVEELHVFAKSIGMKLAWFQDHRLAPHYDLTPKRREKALAKGAVFVPGKEQARKRIEARKKK